MIKLYLLLIFTISYTHSLNVTSPASLEGYYPTPSCEYNKIYGGDEFDAVPRQLVYLDFDFCTLHEELIQNLEDVVVMIDNLNCFPEEKALNAYKSGAKRIVIETRFAEQGAEIHLFYRRMDIDIISMLVDRLSFKLLLSEVQSENNTILVTLQAAQNRWMPLANSPFTFVYRAVFALGAFICSVLAGRKLYFQVATIINVSGLKSYKLRLCHGILFLELICNAALTCYNAIDPCFYSGYLSLPAAMTIACFILFTLYFSLILYQYYWLRFTRIYNTSTFLFLEKNNLHRIFITGIFLETICVIALFFFAIMPPPIGQIFQMISFCAYALFSIPLILIACTNGFQVYNLVKQSHSISQMRAKMITIRMFTCAVAFVGMSISFLLLFFSDLEQLKPVVVSLFMGTQVTAQICVLIMSYTKISSFVTKPQDVSTATSLNRLYVI